MLVGAWGIAARVMGDTALLVVTTDAMTAAAVTGWIADQMPDEPVREVGGFYAAVAELRRGRVVVVADVGDISGRDGWRIAELRAHAPTATAVVVCDASMAPHLSGAVRAELTVSRVQDLPPLRELLVSVEAPAATGQTMRRRSIR